MVHLYDNTQGLDALPQILGQQQKDRCGKRDEIRHLQLLVAAWGLVRRDASERAHVYQARIPREDTEKQLVDAVTAFKTCQRFFSSTTM